MERCGALGVCLLEPGHDGVHLGMNPGLLDRLKERTQMEEIGRRDETDADVMYAPPGTKLLFTNAGGYDWERRAALLHLTAGQAYTLKRSEVGRWKTLVWLEEAGSVAFNSVQFEVAA